MSNDKYITMYKPSISLTINENIITLSSSEIVSITFIHNYDTMTHPIIRLRLYSDISVIQSICENPDDIQVRGLLTGMIYRMNEDNTETKTPQPVATVKEITFSLKGYIENKNIPTSIYDQYKNGLKIESDLNTNVKVPIEIYCYNDTLIHLMKQKSQSIYKNMTLESIITDMFKRNSINYFTIDPIQNQQKYDQVLIPNLNILDAIGFIDQKYGLYPKGCQVYGSINTLKVCDTNVSNGTNVIPIYVESGKSNDDTPGLKYIGNKYQLSTLAGNVSVKTETDIERVLNGYNIAAIDVSSMEVTVEELDFLYASTKDLLYGKKIDTPDIIHKSKSKYIASSYLARLSENMTDIDISGSGFDVSKIDVDTRFNLIFESPIRGIDIGKLYRPSYACHVISNTTGEFFTAQTTMNLRTN